MLENLTQKLLDIFSGDENAAVTDSDADIINAAIAFVGDRHRDESIMVALHIICNDAGETAEERSLAAYYFDAIEKITSRAWIPE